MSGISGCLVFPSSSDKQNLLCSATMHAPRFTIDSQEYGISSGAVHLGRLVRQQPRPYFETNFDRRVRKLVKSYFMMRPRVESNIWYPNAAVFDELRAEFERGAESRSILHHSSSGAFGADQGATLGKRRLDA
jgi:hypothetical protein